MAINISNILAQLNTKMTTDSSSTTTELLRRVQAYNSLNNIGVLQYKSYRDLPDIDSSNVGQIVYVSGSEDDSFGTFFFARAIADDYGNITSVDSLNAGWQKIVLNANDSDNFGSVTDRRPEDYIFQGSSYGYTTGGDAPTSTDNIIQKFSFTTDGNATDVGDLTANLVYAYGGNTSSTHGYHPGGYNSGTAVTTDVIQKHPFSADANASEVGTLSSAKDHLRFASQSSSDNGYVTGGSPVATNEIEKWPFAADGTSTDVGDLTRTTLNACGQSSTTHGYTTGGSTNVIDKFSFATDGNATEVGDIGGNNVGHSGQSSADHGYRTGSNPASNIIQQFLFATDGNSTDVGDLTVARYVAAGSSAVSYGYTAGGGSPTQGSTNIIDKFVFVYNTNATDVGDLTSQLNHATGNQQT